MSYAKEKTTTIWRTPIPWPDRIRIWRQGGRRAQVSWAAYGDITPQLAGQDVEVVPYTIDVDGFWRYVEQVGYRRMDYWGGGKDRAATEKWLEHYVSIDLLRPQAGEVLIDIASCYSPFPDILREQWGCQTYRQDWLYEPGLNGDRIGGDAASLPIPDEFADMLVMHCSFEHFEGDRDMRFLHEASRVLKPGGRLCILPLYTNGEYLVQTDPRAWHLRTPEFEGDATICIADKWGEVHGRFYDGPHFIERILGNLGRLRLQLYRADNTKQVAPDCYLWFAGVFTRA